MREPPKLANEAIVAALGARYDVPVATLTFLPLGSDSASSVYRVDATDGSAYLLKARAGSGFSVQSLAVPRFLRDRGVSHVVAPLPTIDRELWVDAGGFALSLYPYVDGRVGAEGGLSEEQWRTLGATVKRIHASRLPRELVRVVPRERFVPSRRDVIADLESVLDGPNPVDPLQREWAAFWRSRRDEIRAVVHRADVLGRRLRRAPASPVLCHADLHTWNVLVDSVARLWLVDWDETVLAPKERDLMFVAGGIGGDSVTPEGTASFFRGYGAAEVDSTALAYYRYAWAVQDMAAYGERLFFRPDLGEESRRDAVDGFVGLFEPGKIVALALASSDAGDVGTSHNHRTKGDGSA